MKILINASSAKLGGGQTYLKNLLRHLPKEIELSILVLAPNDLDLPMDPRITRISTLWPTRNPILRTLWEKVMLPVLVRRQAIDILFCPGGVVSTKTVGDCKTVTMFRNMIPFDPAVRERIPIGLQRVRNWILERVMLKSLTNADLSIFISNYARGLIEQRATIKNPVTIPHGLSPEFRTHSQVLARPTWLPNESYVLYVSRFDVYKHHMEVVKAYAQLSADLRHAHPLILIGEADTESAAMVRDFIATNGLGDVIRIVGAVKYADLPAVYRHAHVILFASSCENCPNILLEALGAGRPVLSSNVMPMPEFGGAAVEYFSPYDPDDIAGTLERVLCDPDLRSRMSAAAAERSGKYDWRVTAESTWLSIAGLKSNANSHR